MKKLFVLIFCFFTLSVMAEGIHPRLFITDEAMTEVKAKIASGDELTTLLHRETMRLADEDMASGVVLQHKYDDSGRRILGWSRLALKRISACAYAYRYTGDSKYLEFALNDLRTVLAFDDWNAAKHFLDTGEMSLAVAIGYDWLYDVLTPEMKALAEKRVRDYAFDPALNTKGYMYRNNNWNQVCNGGLITAALGMFPLDDPMVTELLTRGVSSNKRAMKIIYSPDGNYPEGASYWNYGTMYEAIMLTAMQDILGTDKGISKTKGFMRTAEYILSCYGAADQYFNYSDFALVEANSCAMWYFAWKQHRPALLYNEARLLRRGHYAEGECERFVPLLMSYAARMDLSGISAPDWHYFSGQGKTPVVLIHTDWTYSASDKFLGIKAGSASAPHAHMDAGSFAYDAYGYRWAMDFPRQGYAPWEKKMDEIGGNLWDQKQDSYRWSIFRYGNTGHNTIIVNGKPFDVNASAGLIEEFKEGRELGATMDLTALYGGDLDYAIRSVKLIDGKYLEITDILKAPEGSPADIQWQIVTPATAKAGASGVKLRQGKVSLKLKTEASGAKLRYRTWTTDPAGIDYIFSDFEEAYPGTVRAGFESHLEAGRKAVFVTTLGL